MDDQKRNDSNGISFFPRGECKQAFRRCTTHLLLLKTHKDVADCFLNSMRDRVWNEVWNFSWGRERETERERETREIERETHKERDTHTDTQTSSTDRR